MLNNFNLKQKEAILVGEGPVLVIAGAGSGKTSVLTQRIVYLIDKKKIPPGNILAVTFTNKAANEMKRRISYLVNFNKKYGFLYNQIWIGTFHATCARILHQQINYLGYQDGFNIYDKNETANLIKKCIKTLNLDSKQYNHNMVSNVIESAKNRLIDENEFSLKAIGFYNKKIGEIYKIYQEKLAKKQALDYGDLILKTVQILQNYSVVLEYYQNKFSYILVDEYQDINHAQYVLIRLLSQKNQNLFLVGDPDQSIYGFRGAELSNIINFENDFPDCKIIKLEQNYRSTEMILKGATGVIRNNKYRKEKILWTNRKGGEKIKFYQATSAIDEAEFIAREITHLKEIKKLNWCHFGVLYRINIQSRPFEEVFAQKNIPFKVIGSSRFYDKNEIRSLINFLKLINNSRDLDCFKRWLEIEKVGIGDKNFQFLSERALTEERPILDILSEYLNNSGNRVTEQNKIKLQKHIRLINNLQKRHDMNISSLAEQLIAEVDYYQLLKDNQNIIKNKNMINNVKLFIQSLREYEKMNPANNLNDYLTYISLISDVDTNNDFKNDNLVYLMTLHCVKGLEFPVIFLTGFEEGLFPHQKSLTNQLELEEERRLCYVGMTRAMERLYITYSWRRNIDGKTAFRQPSRFLNEIPPNCTEKVEFIPPEFPDFKNLNKKDIQIENWILHPDWGEGIITNIKETTDDLYITVQFKDFGIKRLSLKYAPIKKINR